MRERGERGERAPHQLYLSLHRDSPDSAWGFSCSGGRDVEHWGAVMSGLAVSRGEKGLWVSVERVRQDSPAGQADLRPRDFITRINGRIVFHLEPQDVSRLIKNSGKVRLKDLKSFSNSWIYCSGSVSGCGEKREQKCPLL